MSVMCALLRRSACHCVGLCAAAEHACMSICLRASSCTQCVRSHPCLRARATVARASASMQARPCKRVHASASMQARPCKRVHASTSVQRSLHLDRPLADAQARVVGGLPDEVKVGHCKLRTVEHVDRWAHTH